MFLDDDRVSAERLTATGPMFIRNGAIYATRRETLLSGSFKGTDSRGYVMPAERSLNIDTETELAYAESLMRAREGT